MSKFAFLKSQLETRGWEISSLEIPSNIWWAVDIYALKSTWRPIGQTFYMSMLIDTCQPKSNATENDVEAISITYEFPKSHGDGQFIGIKRDFAKRTAKILGLLEKMRNLDDIKQ